MKSAGFVFTKKIVDKVNRPDIHSVSEMAEYLTMAEAARELGVHRQRVFTLMALGRIKDAEISKRKMISRREMERYKRTLAKSNNRKNGKGR